MLKTRGGDRFEGYGNVKVTTERGNRAGWQLICYECQGLSSVIHRTGASFPPKVLVKMFSDKGWKVGNTSASDVCPACLEKRREKHKAERKQYAKGNVDRLLDMIRQIDLMLASNISVEYGPYLPQIAAQLKSLFETAYLCNMLPLNSVGDDIWKAPQTPDVEKLYAELNAANEDKQKLLKLLEEARDQILFAEHLEVAWKLTHPPELKPEPPSEPPPPPPPPPSPPPKQEGTKISPRTAAFLAEIRKQVFKGAEL
jgi:hypothetical protein